MTKEERLGWLKRIEKDICVSSLESTFADDSKSCAIHSIIEELEQEPSEDAISRKSLKEWLDLNFSFGGALEKLEFFKRLDKELPSIRPKQKWIPVSEDLPEDIKPVQITWKNNDPVTYYQDIKGKHFTGTAHYKDGKWYWYSDVTEVFLAEYGRCEIYEFDSAIEVVAWMPMAEPYETESEIEE